jgi:hypothetical protein
LKFEKSHASFQNVGGYTWEKKNERILSLYVCTILLRKWCHHEPTMALTLDDDRQECVLYIYLYVYIHRAQLFTVNYLLSTTIVYVVYMMIGAYT